MADKPKAENRAAADPETSSHIPIHALYTPADLNARNQESEVGYPGGYPFTRGVQATMYRGRLWTMRQYAGMGDAEESNKRYKYLLANGTTGLSVAFDLPTQIGLDSDHPLAVGEVGRVGVAIDSVEDMQRLFDGIDLTKISTSMTINATASILLPLYAAVARRQGIDVRLLSGTVQNDVLKEYIARGTYIFPPAQAMGARSIDDLFSPIPAEYRLERDLKVPRQMAESEIVDWFRERSRENGDAYATFLGAGAYAHYRPVIIDSLISRGEFLTAYTPYQAEISQGTLQAIFEFQTMSTRVKSSPSPG